MRKVLVLSAVGALLLAAAALHSVRKPVWSKAHVPLEKAQLCHNGRVIAVDASAVDMHVEKHGDCFLPVCDFNNVFGPGDECDGGEPGEACDGVSGRDDACGDTDACPAGGDCPDNPLFED